MQTIATELYTAEADESREKAQGDVSVPDPSPTEAAKAIEENEVKNDA